MSSMILAASSPDEQLFWLLAPENPALDGFIIGNGRMKAVPFWSYVSRTPELTPVRGADLLNQLWSKDESEEWAERFYFRNVPLSEDDLMSVEFLLVEVPDEVDPAEERSMDFT